MALKYRSTNVFLKPDVKYKNLVVAKFINYIMKKGKKTTAEMIFYKAMDVIEERIKDDEPIKVFETALENVKPLIETRSKRVGGQTYQVPMEVNRNRATALAFRWLLSATREKSGRPMHIRLADELIDAYKKQGAAMTQRENVHRMAESNKAFAHFAW